MLITNSKFQVIEFIEEKGVKKQWKKLIFKRKKGFMGSN